MSRIDISRRIVSHNSYPSIAILPMTGIEKPKLIFVWLVWVENRQPMTDKVETNFEVARSSLKFYN
jgi:hypothetical protein